MNTWVYKNNAGNESYQNASGDWSNLFAEGEREWGRSAWFRSSSARRVDEDMAVGDRIICHQSDRRCWVGLAVVVALKPTHSEGTSLVLRPTELFVPELRVALIKSNFPKFSAVTAFRPGNIETIYELSNSEQSLIEKIIRWAPRRPV